MDASWLWEQKDWSPSWSARALRSSRSATRNTPRLQSPPGPSFKTWHFMTVRASETTKARNIKFPTHSLSRDSLTSTTRSRLFSWSTSPTFQKLGLTNYQGLPKTYFDLLRVSKTSWRALSSSSIGQTETLIPMTTARKLKRWVNLKIKEASCLVKKRRCSSTSFVTTTGSRFSKLP